jgi:hypothetical protein
MTAPGGSALPDTCNSLWIGPRLGAVERACLRSLLRQGHRLVLWCYAAPDGVPAGVELRDARALLPESRIVVHKGGSPALFTNLFRYELMRRGLGLWVDCDVYALAPLAGLPDLLFGWETERTINTAVLRLPPDSPLLAPLIRLFEEKEVPPWLPLHARAAAWRRLKRSGRIGLPFMPWGTAGPQALTWLAQRAGLDSFALPRSVFYPMPWTKAAWIRDPAIALEDVAAPETRTVHLWNELVKGFKDAPAPRGSFLARLQVEGAPD